MNSYEDWKAQQPPRDLPDSCGPTAENLAYLKEHYTGDLSWEERIDALNTMMDMGVITRDQRNEALGGGFVSFNAQETAKQFMCKTVEGQTANPAFLSGNWDVSLAHFTASRFRTADDLFTWLDEILAWESRDGEALTEEDRKVKIPTGEAAQSV